MREIWTFAKSVKIAVRRGDRVKKITFEKENKTPCVALSRCAAVLAVIHAVRTCRRVNIFLGRYWMGVIRAERQLNRKANDLCPFSFLPNFGISVFVNGKCIISLEWWNNDGWMMDEWCMNDWWMMDEWLMNDGLYYI